MANNFYTGIDMHNTEILNVLAQVLGSNPGSPVEGQFWYNSTTKKLMFRSDGANIDPTARANHSGTQAASTISDFTSAVNALLTTYALLASPTFTGTPAAPTAAAGTNTTQLATTAYVIAEILARIASNDAMLYKGAIDASGNPNYPAADAGFTYRISVAGKIGGASGVNVEIGDLIICHVDSSSAGNQATVGANWDVIQINIDGAVTLTGTQSLTNKTISALLNTITNIGAANIIADLITGQTAETSIADGDFILIYDLSATALRKMTKANFVAGLATLAPYSTTIGDGTATVFTIPQATHGKRSDSSNNVIVQNATTGEVIYPNIVVNPANGTVTITFSPTVLASNAARVHIS